MIHSSSLGMSMLCATCIKARCAAFIIESTLSRFKCSKANFLQAQAASFACPQCQKFSFRKSSISSASVFLYGCIVLSFHWCRFIWPSTNRMGIFYPFLFAYPAKLERHFLKNHVITLGFCKISARSRKSGVLFLILFMFFSLSIPLPILIS